MKPAIIFIEYTDIRDDAMIGHAITGIGMADEN